MTMMLLLLAAILGVIIGSFLNVVIWRVPREESLIRPPSACPACQHPIRPWDNIPVISWLLLGGRCRDCHTPISRRYPLVEALTGVMFMLVVARFGWSWALPTFLYLAAIAIALTLIDLDHKRLPDAIVIPAWAVTAAGLLLASLNPGGTPDWSALLRAGIGGAGLFAFYFVVWFIYPSGMGFGDVKLSGVIGMALGWLSWGALAVGAFAAFVLGGIVGVGLIVLRRGNRRTAIPYGPWMVAGAIVGVAVGEPLWDAYLQLWL